MGLKAGALLWNRQRLSLPPGTVTVNGILPSTTPVNTGLTQPNRSFPSYSPDEPPLAGVAPSRVQVIPMAPLSGWTNITHGEPFLDPATDTVWVTFFNNGLTPADITALFWDPHSMVGPGEADLYNPLL